MQHVAYVDESEPDSRFDPGTYILCAAIIASESHESVREVMRSLRRAGQRKVHWHDENARERVRLLRSVALLGLDHLVVVRSRSTGEPSERRRRLCLERLCFELDALGIESVVLESRGPSDRLDRTLIDSLRSKKVISSALRVDHCVGPAEPLLWIADLVCGAVGLDRRGDPSCLDAVRPSVIHLDI